MFEVYDRLGQFMAARPSLVEAERHLGAWFDAGFIVQTLSDGGRWVVRERFEITGKSRQLPYPIPGRSLSQSS